MGLIDTFVLNWGAGDRELSSDTLRYTITQLEAGREYTISFTASNAAGSITRQLTASTTGPKAEATSSSTASVALGVLAVVVVVAAVIITAVVIVIVILLKKHHRAEGIAIIH